MQLADRFSTGQIEKMISNLNNAGKPYGIQFNKFSILPNSHLALLAGEYAKENNKFHEFHEEIFNSYFAYGKNIGDKTVISSVAEKIGLDSNDMLKSINMGKYEKILDEAQQAGRKWHINSTPTFIIDGKYVVTGAQPLEKFREILLQIEAE